MDIRHLRLFLTVLDHGNISAAAQELGISQPALSKQLGRLEQECGMLLLERLPRGVRPTRQGTILADYARSIDASYRSALRHLADRENDNHDEISVGAGFFWLNGLLPRAVAHVVSKHPNARIKILAGVPEELTKQLLNGELDLFFGPVAFREKQRDIIEAESLIRTDIQVMARQGHPADTGKDLSIQDLSLLKWALPRGTFVRKRFDQLFEAYGLSPPVPVVEANEVSSTLEFVAKTDLATLAASVDPLGRPWPKLRKLRCDHISGFRETGILRRKRDVLPELGVVLCDSVRSHARRHVHAVDPQAL